MKMRSAPHWTQWNRMSGNLSLSIISLHDALAQLFELSAGPPLTRLEHHGHEVHGFAERHVREQRVVRPVNRFRDLHDVALVLATTRARDQVVLRDWITLPHGYLQEFELPVVTHGSLSQVGHPTLELAPHGFHPDNLSAAHLRTSEQLEVRAVAPQVEELPDGAAAETPMIHLAPP